MRRKRLVILSVWFVWCSLRAAGAQQIEMTRVSGLGGDPPVIAGRGHLVVWGMDKELQVFDATPPGPPQLTSRTTMDDEITRIVFVGERLCWFYSGQARLADLSDPANPRLYSPQPPIYFTDIASSGTLLGLAKRGDPHNPSRLELVDIADPSQPRELGGLDLGTNSSCHVALAGNLALLGYTFDGAKLHVVDVAQPTSPVLLTTMEIARNESIYDMVSSGTTLYVAMDEGLYVLDCSQGDTPKVKYAWNNDPSGNFGPPVSWVALAGNHACVTQPGSMSILDLSDPSTVTLLGTLGIPGGSPYSVGGIAYCGDIAYITTEGAGVLAVDVSDPRAPRLDGGYYIPTDARGVDVWGGTVWVTNGGGGLIGIDIRDPARPRGEKLLPFEGDLGTTAAAADYGNFDAVKITDGLAYVAATRAFGVIDVRDPSKPVQMGLWRYPWPGDISNSRVSVSGQYAALSATSAYTLFCPLRVMDIKDPWSPTLIGIYAEPGTGVPDAVIEDHLIYFLVHNVLGGPTYLRILELGTGGTLIARGSVEVGGVALALNRPYLYVGGTVCDVSNPDAPFVCGPFFQGGVCAMFIRSHVLFVAEPGSDVHAFDLTDPHRPRLCGSYRMEGPYPYETPYVQAVYADDTYLYLAAGNDGFELVRYQYRNSSHTWQLYQ